MSASWRIPGLTALLVFLLAGQALALALAPGELDPTFGGGRVTVPLGSDAGATGIAVAPDGKVVVAGYSAARPGFVVARLLPDGSPDPSWGGTGVVNTPLDEKTAFAADVAVQSDGKVVAVGGVYEDFAIVRYLENGELDLSFGEGGVVVLPIGTLGDFADAVAIGPGGSIAMTGTSGVSPGVLGAGVAVLKPNGNPETNFSADGRTIVTTESDNDDRGEGIAVQADGRVLIADATGGGFGDGFTIVRLGTDGEPDPTFAGDGVAETPIPGEGKVSGGRSSDVAIQPDGKIVAGGYGADYTGPSGEEEYIPKFALVRYGADGELDPSFGTDGIVSARFGKTEAFGQAVAVAPDGQLVLAGSYDGSLDPTESSFEPMLMRVNSNGSLDSTFGTGGAVLGKPLSGIGEEQLKGMALQADGRILTSTSPQPIGGGGSAVVSRYLAVTPPASGNRPVSPSSAFSFAGIKLNKKTGTARLTVKVPGPGSLALKGKKVIKRSAVAAGARTLKLLIKAKGRAKHRLDSLGKAVVKLNVTFTPDGGLASSKTKTLRLIKRLK